MVEVLLSKRAVPGAASPGPCAQYSQVPGTELALIVVGDPVGATDRAEVFVTEQLHFALLTGFVGVPTAVHLVREQIKPW